MLSWIFRNRARLRTIYGAPTPPALPGARFARAPRPQLPVRRARRARPGEVWRTARHVSVRPMPPRVPLD
jgi:hypothetical protein